MPRPAEGAFTMRAFLITLIAVLSAGLTAGLAGCAAGADGGGAGAGPASPGRTASPAPDAPSRVAMAYVRALYSTSHRDAEAGDWLRRVRPLVTEEWYAALRKRGAKAGGAGDGWRHVRRLRLEPRFDRLDARRVVEAPNTADRRYVRVIYALAYVGADGRRPTGKGVPADLGSGGPRPRILVLSRTPEGWLVTEDQTGKAG
ncbi:MAG: hypothetical protein GEV11_13865 [Streptosporangiales bacterium]|nr:hypothetical protein [Streptosporangiales bacterium]